MKIKNFTPNSEWSFAFKDAQDKIVVYPLVGFAVIEDADGTGDSVVGMVSVHGGGRDDKVMPGTCRLSPVPPISGTYMHRNDVSGVATGDPWESFHEVTKTAAS